MDRVKALQAALIAVLFVLVACSPADYTASVDGTWYIASASLGGVEMSVPELGSVPLELHDGSYIYQNDTGTYSLMPDSKPAALDVKGERGPNAGKTIPAIYKMENDTLTICYDLSMTERPKTFASEPGTQTFLAKYTKHSK